MQGELRKRIRFRSLFGISALLYVVFYVSLFHFKWILLGGGIFLLWELSLGLLCLDYQRFWAWKIKHIVFFLILLALLLFWLLPLWNVQNGLAVLASVVSIPVLFYAYGRRLRAFRKFNVWSYFSQWRSWLMLFFTLVFGFSMLGSFHQLPFSCEQFTHLNQHFRFFWGEKAVFEQKASEESWFWTKVVDKIEDTKGIVWDNVLATQRELNHQVCLSLYEQLEKLYTLPAFQLGFLLALYMLTYGLMRFFLKVIAGIGVVVFWSLYKLWFYQKKQILSEVEEIV